MSLSISITGRPPTPCRPSLRLISTPPVAGVPSIRPQRKARVPLFLRLSGYTTMSELSERNERRTARGRRRRHWKDCVSLREKIPGLRAELNLPNKPPARTTSLKAKEGLKKGVFCDPCME